MREIDAIYLNGVWLRRGGNTPFRDFPTKAVINSIKMIKPDPRNFKGADSVFISIEFDDDYLIEIKTNDYMVGY